MGIVQTHWKKQVNNNDKRSSIINYNRQGRSKIDNWGGGADIHIFVFTNHKNNWFQKKSIVQNPNI